MTTQKKTEAKKTNSNALYITNQGNVKRVIFTAYAEKIAALEMVTGVTVAKKFVGMVKGLEPNDLVICHGGDGGSCFVLPKGGSETLVLTRKGKDEESSVEVKYNLRNKHGYCEVVEMWSDAVVTAHFQTALKAAQQGEQTAAQTWKQFSSEQQAELRQIRQDVLRAQAEELSKKGHYIPKDVLTALPRAERDSLLAEAKKAKLKAKADALALAKKGEFIPQDLLKALTRDDRGEVLDLAKAAQQLKAEAIINDLEETEKYIGRDGKSYFIPGRVLKGLSKESRKAVMAAKAKADSQLAESLSAHGVEMPEPQEPQQFLDKPRKKGKKGNSSGNSPKKRGQKMTAYKREKFSYEG